MNSKYFYIVFLALMFSGVVHAQVNLLNATSVETIGKKTSEQVIADNDKPLPYGYIDDRDVLYSYVVWEFIDLNQKINLPYYFPIDTTSISSNRRSLFDTLLKGLKTGGIKEAYENSFFSSKITRQEIAGKLLNIRNDGDNIDTFSIKSQDISGYQIKGMWYFDKRQGELKYRLLALAPMGPDVQTLGVAEIDDEELYPLFWIFYPSAREVLHNVKVFNPENASHPISYDHLLNARRFSATITRVENIYGNRKISDYIRGNALFQLLEADKIKERIRNREMDMWNY
ncbi:MAG: gliding motility protein GldN [Polaribacter sp.]|nr:gliding motility protein GldN [Polaribacter sp.]